MEHNFNQIKYYARLIQGRSIIKMRDCLFVHTPKNGGTSINQALYNRSFGHFIPNKKVINSIFQNIKVVGVVREPKDRLISALSFSQSGSSDFTRTFDGQALDIERLDRYLSTCDDRRRDPIFQTQSLYLREDYIVKYSFAELGKLQKDLGIEIGHVNSSKQRIFIDEEKLEDIVQRHYQDDIALWNNVSKLS